MYTDIEWGKSKISIEKHWGKWHVIEVKHDFLTGTDFTSREEAERELSKRLGYFSNKLMPIVFAQEIEKFWEDAS